MGNYIGGPRVPLALWHGVESYRACCTALAKYSEIVRAGESYRDVYVWHTMTTMTTTVGYEVELLWGCRAPRATHVRGAKIDRKPHAGTN